MSASFKTGKFSVKDDCHLMRPKTKVKKFYKKKSSSKGGQGPSDS